MYFKTRFELKAYGEEFNDSYILLKLLDKNQVGKFSKDLAKFTKLLDADDVDKTISSSESIMDKMYSVCADAFISGEIFDEADGKIRPIQKADIDNFPPAVVKDMVYVLQGNLEKKA